MPSEKPKKIRRKVIKAEKTHGRVPGWLLDLECGHLVEIMGWGGGAGIDRPATTVCNKCTASAQGENKNGSRAI